MTRLVRTLKSEAQQLVWQELQSQPHVLCVPENLKFNKLNLSLKNPNPNPNPYTLTQLQPHVWCVRDNLKFSNLSHKNPNPNHKFVAYPRTRNSAIYLARTPTPIPYINPNTGQVRILEPAVQQFVQQEHQPQSQKFTSTPSTHVRCVPENLKFSNLSCINPNSNHTFGAYART